MAYDRPLLRPITHAIHRADSADDLRDRVCRAAVDGGYRYACFLDGDRLPVATGLDMKGAKAFLDADRPEEVQHRHTDDHGDHVVVPVVYGGERYGTLVLGTNEPIEDDTDRERLAGVGDTVGHGIASMLEVAERERAEAALRRERQQVEKLHSVAAQMVGLDDQESIYELAMDAAENILEFDLCTIDVVEGDFLVPKAISTGMAPEDSERVPKDQGVAGRTHQENTTVRVNDVQSYSDADPSNPDYQSVLSVPIGDLGVFQAASVEQGAFSERDAELAELLMAHVAETLQRQRSDAALRESEKKYRTLVEQSHDAVAIFRDAGYEFVNQRACELFDRDREALLSMDGWELIHPDDRDRLKEIHEELHERPGEHRTFEARILRANDETRHCEFSATSIEYRDDVATLASIRDITERKEHERELERQNERLEEFASVVSHDLRSPINVVRGSVDLARRTGEAEHFERAEDALDRMEALVEDVLDLARQGKLVDETEAVDLSAVAASAWNTAASEAATLDVRTNGAVVDADPTRLQELLENLFRNAIEHGGEDVTVVVSETADGFAVADDGPGIPEEDVEDVFERGYTSADDGTGFGLAIVENIAEAHGWDISAVPDEDGARFEVRGATPRS